MSSQRNRNIAMRRLKRDLIELERADIPTIAAQPLDYNIFEWHVNIKPSDGVYSGVYFHLIMIFPETYPKNPPDVKICTPIAHPNIFDDWICLSMLRPHTKSVPYEGWSGAYSATSILMQLQSFVFAKKIDQDEGYQLDAELDWYDVQRSIRICKQFECSECQHCHYFPWPEIKGGEQDNDYKEIEDKEHSVNWHDHHIIDELWLSIFESLQVQEKFRAKFVCKKWHKLLTRYNIMERNELCCYYTKAKLGQGRGGKILGIGLTLKAREYGGYDFNSQMDILSLDAWLNGCKIGVWGEILTHFLPLVMNREHAEIADEAIHKYLKKIKLTLDSSDKGYSNRNPNEFDRIIAGNKNLQLIDTLITMMNQIVVQFVMGNENIKQVSMIMCEKVVLGYCALHHLLLYLKKKYGADVRNFANRKVWHFINKKDGHNKTNCKDLGKFLIYLTISSQYTWNDVCGTFIEEVFTRNVRWMVQDEKYKKYDTTNDVKGRVNAAFQASKTSRRLVMFQVWFMKNVASETLHSYNQRLGRPRMKIKNAIGAKTKYILRSTSWDDYFKELGVIIKSGNKAIAQLLRFAIYNSKKNRYHKSYGCKQVIEKVDAPEIKTNDPNYKGPRKFVKEPPSFAIKSIRTTRPTKSVQGPSVTIKSSGSAWNKTNITLKASLSAWRGRGRGGTTRYHNVASGRGRGFGPTGPSQQQQQRRPQQNRSQNQQEGGRGVNPSGPQQPQPVRQPGQASIRGRGRGRRFGARCLSQQQQQRRPELNQSQNQQGGERGRGFNPSGPPQNNQHQQQQNMRASPPRNHNQYQNATRDRVQQQPRQSSMRERGAATAPASQQQRAPQQIQNQNQQQIQSRQQSGREREFAARVPTQNNQYQQRAPQQNQCQNQQGGTSCVAPSDRDASQNDQQQETNIYDNLKSQALKRETNENNDQNINNEQAIIDTRKSKLNPEIECLSQLQYASQQLLSQLHQLNAELRGLKDYGDNIIKPRLHAVNTDIMIWESHENRHMLNYPANYAQYSNLKAEQSTLKQFIFDNHRLYITKQQELKHTQDLYDKLHNERQRVSQQTQHQNQHLERREFASANPSQNNQYQHITPAMQREMSPQNPTAPIQNDRIERQHQPHYKDIEEELNQNPQHRVTPSIQNEINTVPLCEYYQTPQGCALGQSCNYRH